MSALPAWFQHIQPTGNPWSVGCTIVRMGSTHDVNVGFGRSYFPSIAISRPSSRAGANGPPLNRLDDRLGLGRRRGAMPWDKS